MNISFFFLFISMITAQIIKPKFWETQNLLYTHFIYEYILYLVSYFSPALRCNKIIESFRHFFFRRLVPSRLLLHTDFISGSSYSTRRLKTGRHCLNRKLYFLHVFRLRDDRVSRRSNTTLFELCSANITRRLCKTYVLWQSRKSPTKVLSKGVFASRLLSLVCRSIHLPPCKQSIDNIQSLLWSTHDFSVMR